MQKKQKKAHKTNKKEQIKKEILEIIKEKKE